MKSLGIEEVDAGIWTPEDQLKLTQVYDELLEQNPRSMACARIPLDFKVPFYCLEVNLPAQFE